MARNFYPERTDGRGLQKNQRAVEALLDLLTDADGGLLVSLLTHDHDAVYLRLNAANDPVTAPLEVQAASAIITANSTTAGQESQFRMQTTLRLWLFKNNAVGNFVIRDATGLVDVLTLDTSKNMGLNGVSFGGGVGVVFLANRTTAPTTNPTGGAIEYVEGGAGKARGSSGSVTTRYPA